MQIHWNKTHSGCLSRPQDRCNATTCSAISLIKDGFGAWLLCSPYLVVLSSNIRAFHPFLMSNLHEKPTYKCLFNSVVELYFIDTLTITWSVQCTTTKPKKRRQCDECDCDVTEATAVWQSEGFCNPLHWDKQNEQGSDDRCENASWMSVTSVGVTMRRDWCVWEVYRVAATLAATW